jgi:LPS-assembly lipoprotein
MRRTLAVLAVGLTTLLGACGFQPVYAPGASARSLGNITIPEIEGRTGFLLRQELQKRVAAGATDPGAPARTLFLTLKEDLLPVVTRIDGFASRSDLSGTVVYYLSPAKPGDKAISGFIVVSVGLNQEGAPFGDVALQSDAEERLAVAIAERLHAEILLKSAAPKP